MRELAIPTLIKEREFLSNGLGDPKGFEFAAICVGWPPVEAGLNHAVLEHASRGGGAPIYMSSAKKGLRAPIVRKNVVNGQGVLEESQLVFDGTPSSSMGQLPLS